MLGLEGGIIAVSHIERLDILMKVSKDQRVDLRLVYRQQIPIRDLSVQMSVDWYGLMVLVAPGMLRCAVGGKLGWRFHGYIQHDGLILCS